MLPLLGASGFCVDRADRYDSTDCSDKHDSINCADKHDGINCADKHDSINCVEQVGYSRKYRKMPVRTLLLPGILIFLVSCASFLLFPLRHSSASCFFGLILAFPSQAFLPSKIAWPDSLFSHPGIPASIISCASFSLSLLRHSNTTIS